MRRLMVFLGLLTAAGVVTITLFSLLGAAIDTKPDRDENWSCPICIVAGDKSCNKRCVVRGSRQSESQEQIDSILRPRDETPRIEAEKPRVTPPEEPEPLAPETQCPRDDPIPISRVEPLYPRALARQGIEGDVTLEFTIQKDGAIGDIKIIDATHPAFGESAVNAVSRWRYRPPCKNGEFYEIKGVRVTISYRLDDDED